MTTIQHTLIEAGDQEFLTVLIGGSLMPPIDDSHPNFEKIKDIVTNPDAHGVHGDDHEGLRSLFDLAETISRKFEKLSERVTVNGGTLFFDGDPIDGTVVETILRFLDEGVDDWQPLVQYVENIQNNPEPHSREQLFDWLKHDRSISLNEDGLIVAYKGVASGGKNPIDGTDCWRSTHAGTATVDGVVINDYIPNYVGAEVTMPRSAVMHDPQASCHAGLHVGTFPYAQNYGRDGAMLAVLVNPRDVVSVPHDARGEKIRVSRYKVLAEVTEPYSGVLVASQEAPAPVEEEERTAYFAVGDRVKDREGDRGTVRAAPGTSDTGFEVNYTAWGSSDIDIYDPQGGDEENGYAPFVKINEDVPVQQVDEDVPVQQVDDLVLDKPKDEIKIGDFVGYVFPGGPDNKWIGTVVRIEDNGLAAVKRPASGVGSDQVEWPHLPGGGPWSADVRNLQIVPNPNKLDLKVGDRVTGTLSNGRGTCLGTVTKVVTTGIGVPVMIDLDEPYGVAYVTAQGTGNSAYYDVNLLDETPRDDKGRFVKGRPSKRDASGRFVG